MTNTCFANLMSVVIILRQAGSERLRLGGLVIAHLEVVVVDCQANVHRPCSIVSAGHLFNYLNPVIRPHPQGICSVDRIGI